MISTEYFQDLAGFPVGALVQDVGGFGVDLHGYTIYQLQLRDTLKEIPLAEAQRR